MSRLPVLLAAIALAAAGCGSDRPSEFDDDVQQEIAQVHAESSVAIVDEVEAAVTNLAGTAGPPDEHVRCTEGQHNWKIDDPHDLFCRASVAVSVRVPEGDARDGLLALHEHLVDEGWSGRDSYGGEPRDLVWVLDQYGDRAAAGRWVSSSGTTRDYGFADLPSVAYWREPGGPVLLLWFDEADGNADRWQLTIQRVVDVVR